MSFPQTAQECFDQIVNHLRIQACKSIEAGGICYYRLESDDRTLKCAAGCLIPDEVYSPLMEYNKIDYVILNFPQLEPLEHFSEIIEEFQRVHDFSPLEHWERRFKEIAIEYNLAYTPIVQLHSL
jgi:hypothetical protein